MWNKFMLLSIFAFTQSLTTSFDLRAVINGDRMASVPLGMTLGSGELDVEGICTKSGMTCQNCTEAITCIPLPGGWLKVPLEECIDGLTCNAHLGKCSMQAAPECEVSAQEFVHTCEQVGIFPDAFDCRKFHLCSPPEGFPDGRPAEQRAALCPRHYGYNPQTAQCSIKLHDGQCSEKPVPDCKSIGQNGVLSTSTNHYYVCLMRNRSLYPQIFLCPHGWHFWGGFCQPEPDTKEDTPFVTDRKSTEKPFVKSTEDRLEETQDRHEEIQYRHEKTQDRHEKTQDRHEETQDKKEESSSVSVEEVEATTRREYKIDRFFSTEKTTTYAADTFLADRFDLTQYETTDEQPSHQPDFFNSFENVEDYW